MPRFLALSLTGVMYATAIALVAAMVPAMRAPTVAHTGHLTRAAYAVRHGATVAYSVPSRMDEVPTCARGRYFTPTRVAIGRTLAHGQWNAAHDRIRFYAPGYRAPVVFDGVRAFNATRVVATLEGRCL